jgi:hypothetical protein
MRALPVPAPRRRLSRTQAAAYCGISPTLFDDEVRAGRHPISKGEKGGRKVWDVEVLDAALDEVAGIRRASAGGGPFLKRLANGGRRAAGR